MVSLAIQAIFSEKSRKIQISVYLDDFWKKQLYVCQIGVKKPVGWVKWLVLDWVLTQKHEPGFWGKCSGTFKKIVGMHS